MALSKDKGGRIEELGDENYIDWTLQMKSLLIVKELWEAVENQPVQAPQGARPIVNAAAEAEQRRQQQELLDAYQRQEESFNDWKQKSDKALAHITMNVSRINRSLINRAVSGRQAWEVLSDHHRQQAVGTRIRLQVKLGQTFINPNESMRGHLNNIWEMMNKLEDAGGHVDDEYRVAAMLASIRTTYPTIATVVGGKPENELTPVTVKAALIEEYESMMQSRQPQASGTSRRDFGLESQQNRRGQGSFAGRDMSQLTCNFCKQPGHFKRNCPSLKVGDEDLREIINEIRKKKENKANAAEKGQHYTDCVFIPSTRDDSWVIDSGATCHMTPNKNLFSKLDRSHRSDIVVANGKKVIACGIGCVELPKEQNRKTHRSLKLDNALWVPDLRTSLLSVSQLAKEGNIIVFDNNGVYLNDRKIAAMNNNQYICDSQALSVVQENIDTAEENGKWCIHEWHRRMAHRNIHDIKYMRRFGLPVKDCDCSDDCEDCFVGKMKKRPFGRGTVFSQPLDCVVSDVCGPLQTESIGRKRYFVTFIDAYSRYCEVNFIREKSDVTEAAIHFIERMKNAIGRKPKIFRSDRGTEYMDHRFQSYLADQGIWFECTVGYCPEQNGMAEKKNDTLMCAARTMLNDANLSKNHWAEAVASANHSTNRIISRGHDKSPYEMLFEKKPKWCEFRQFGCEVYVKVPDAKRRKLDPKAIKMKFVGFDTQSKGYRVSNGQKVFVSREVRFPSDTSATRFLNDFDDDDDDENGSRKDIRSQHDESDPETSEPSEESDEFLSAEESDGNPDEDVSQGEHSQVQEEQPVLRRSTREGVRPRYLDDFFTEQDDITFTASRSSEINDPKSIAEALKCEDASEWQDAMKSELESIEANETWDLTELPPGRKAIGSKWVFKTKVDANGNPDRKKARLVAQGFSQKYGVDYDEVFAPVARSVTLRMMLSTAGANKLIVKQYDIKTAFLNGKLEEEIFMRPPPGFQRQDGKVYKLRKSLYGLRQAARVWNQTLHESLTKNGFQQNGTDNCLYLLKSGGEVVHLLIHVDDMLAATSNERLLDNAMEEVGKDFELKCLGIAKHYVGIDLDRDKDGHFWISQSAYIRKIIESAKLTNAKPSKLPLDTGYYKLDGEVLNSNEEYRRLIGMLLFLATNSRPDIAASVAILSQRVQQPRDVDMNEVKRVVKYLAGTQHLKLQLSVNNCKENLFAFSDSDWAENRQDRKSHSGMISFVNGGAVMWSCKKQPVVAMSSAEAEYVALSETCKEMIWINRMAKHFEIKTPVQIPIYSDSQSAIAMVDKNNFSHRTKHIDTRYHFIKDLAEKKVIKLNYHPTATNIADMLTKPLGGNKIQELRNLAALRSSQLLN